MKNWINAKIEILKRKLIKLGKLLLSLLIIWATIRFDAFWITISALVAYNIYMIPTYWDRYLDKQRARFKENLAMIDKDSKHWKINKKQRFGYKL